MSGEHTATPVTNTDEPEARAIFENKMLTTGGIIEVAIRNPNVAEYMRHWEERAETAEARVTVLESALRGMVSAYEAKSDEPDERVNAWMDALRVLAKAEPTP